jgi:hypothetical protein
LNAKLQKLQTPSTASTNGHVKPAFLDPCILPG